jgi:myo-inositol 2-dehydrogenase/D-chiro-inositol 1-dehydrogenase
MRELCNPAICTRADTKGCTVCQLRARARDDKIGISSEREENKSNKSLYNKIIERRIEMLRVGIVGCGMIGKEHAKRIQYKIQGAEVVAVCDVFEEGAKKASELIGGVKIYTDFNDLVNDADVDAVVVTTPGQFHKDPVIAAIKAGKPVFTEKPLTNTAAECKEIVDAEMASGKHLVQVGFMRRYDRGYNQVRDMIRSGEFGSPMLLKCTHRAEAVADDYTTEMAVTDTAIHEIDVLPWLIGENEEWDEVQVIMPKQTKNAHAGLKDPQLMMMKTKSGVVAMVEVNVNCGFGYDINCEVVCEDGVINLPCPSFPTTRKNFEVATAIEKNWILRFIDSYDVELQDWVDKVAEGTTGGSSAWDGYVAAITADALVKAQKSGAIEKVVTGGTPDFYKK